MAKNDNNFGSSFVTRLIPFFLGVVLVAGGWYFLVPEAKEVLETRDSIKRDNQRLEKLKSKVNDLEGLNEYELTKRAQLSLKAISSEKNFIEILLSLNKLAISNSLTVEDFQVLPGQLSFNSKGSLTSKIKLKGSIDNLKAFLDETGKTIPLISPIGKIQVDWSSAPTVAVVIESYFVPLPTVLGALDSPVAKLTSDEEKVLKSLSDFNYFSLGEIPATTSSGRVNPFAF